MRIAEVITEGTVARISKQQALDRGMFGPVYHGTTEEGRTAIAQQGFKIHGQDDIASQHGFQGKFNTGYPGIPPVHLLGYGVYFSPSPTVAKQYNRNSMRGIVEYYLDVPRLEEIGFQSVNTIWRWWVQHGYDFDPNLFARRNETYDSYAINGKLVQEQIRATKHMTDVLASQFDAVYLKRSAYRRGVDDTQICVYDPRHVYQIDKSLAGGWDVGAIVTHNQSIIYGPAWMQEHGLRAEPQPDGWTHVTRPWPEPDSETRIAIHRIPPPGMKGKIVDKRPINHEYPTALEFLRKSTDPRFHNQIGNNISVKWQKGGIQHNYYEAELDPAVMRESR